MGADAALDPFYGLHLALATEVRSPGGRYVTCSLAGQNEYSAVQAAAEPLDTHRILRTVMFRNLSVIGNCIGTHDELSARGDTPATTTARRTSARCQP